MIKRVAAEPIYGPINTLQFSWSPDSKWLAYTLTNRAGFQTISLYALETDRSSPLTTDSSRRRSGIRLQRQVPLFPGLDRRGTGQELVRPIQHRHAADVFDLAGHAREGDA